jgi:hypothetical protein
MRGYLGRAASGNSGFLGAPAAGGGMLGTAVLTTRDRLSGLASRSIVGSPSVIGSASGPKLPEDAQDQVGGTAGNDTWKFGGCETTFVYERTNPDGTKVPCYQTCCTLRFYSGSYYGGSRTWCGGVECDGIA